MRNVQEMALPLSFAAVVVLIVAGTLASPPWTGVLYLMSILAGAGAAYYLLPLGPGRPDSKRARYGAVEHPHDPVHADADEATSS